MPSKELRDSLRGIFGDVAPKLAELTETVVFDDVWERKALSKRDRSVVTVSALIAMGRLEQLPAHMGRALDNGVTQAEIEEIVTHLAIYAGFPCAISAARIANEVFQERAAKRSGG
ncbi:4-carboxymuconolactone decarboxylase [Panacagrimonas perspica]|uniref:4-carboxymuconolactone decarboxylase n=1 Tax=Panacagrimonas perspica TaxID=381431 RepID=A0A4R7PDK9_9GAMM|nr:carboxymuconolactone decarboxylase family protein [Panacagrimonas perspica]TDU31832.1 4-carboxymuconolactone decarboxylase [Panacagrimonas perspica]THD02962.1 carboxymuconolactone decarboxylase [Panacagrimonas perspica]